jgi:predicted HTH domain antitoxin
MSKITIDIPQRLSEEIKGYENSLTELLAIGLKEVKIQQALALFKQGNISLWRAASLANVSLREMTTHAVAQGLKPKIDEKMKEEELR